MSGRQKELLFSRSKKGGDATASLFPEFDSKQAPVPSPEVPVIEPETKAAESAPEPEKKAEKPRPATRKKTAKKTARKKEEPAAPEPLENESAVKADEPAEETEPVAEENERDEEVPEFKVEKQEPESAPEQPEDSGEAAANDSEEEPDETPEPAPEAGGNGDDDEGDEPPPHDHLPVHERHGPLTNLIDFNFLQYASYVICERAIPNLADGLKPVQRRIMHALKEKDDGRFIKVANVVGHTMQYHPHGDASIGDALVNLANKRYLIEGQGNFGNIYTGDPAAASRYIECRLTDLARNELFNKDLTEWIPSYDGRNKEPVTLPSKLPLLLMLGAEGIAVGLSTRILPHNFIELLEAEIEILQEKKLKPAEIRLMPDFITGGLMDVSEYDKGNGKVRVRAKIEKRGKNALVIRDLPFGQTTESLVSSIEDAVKKKKVPVRSISDFTAEKVEVELTLSQGAVQEKALKKLYAFTNCETSVSSRIVVIRDRRPVELNVEQVLRENTVQLLDILKRELELRRHQLLEEFHSKTLIQIFVENRLYKRIEECKTYEAVIEEVFKGLEPFRPKLKRDVTKDDVEMLLGIRIKRISRFDIEKNRKDIEAILAELEEVEKNLRNLKSYAVRYLKALIKKYKKEYPRRTQCEAFEDHDLRKLTANELKICYDQEKGYIGYGVKGEEVLKCSSLDKLIFIKNDGTYTVMSPPETLFVGETGLAYYGVYNRSQIVTCVYTDKKVTYIKRFKIGGAIMNRDYNYAPEKATVLLCCDGTPEMVYVKYRPAKGQRITQQMFKPEQVLIKGVKAKGKQMTSKSIARIETSPGRWWKNDEDSPMGVLL